MINQRIFSLLQCPTCRVRPLILEAQGVRCPRCQTLYPFCDGYIDLMPRGTEFDYVSKYVSDEEQLAAELDYRELAPPLLAAGVRDRTLRRLMRWRTSDVVLDNGCGTAKHIDAYLAETARVLRPGGRMMAFSNTRERSPIQPLIDISRHIGRLFVKAGVYDFEREKLRKSDHIKALETWEDVLAAFERAGLRPVKVIFWNSLFTTFVEHVLMKLGEAIIGRTRSRTATNAAPSNVSAGAAREIRARQRMRHRLRKKGLVYYALLAITLLMELDLWLFGWMRCGSYFILVEKPRS
jgi:hypothetical protein